MKKIDLMILHQLPNRVRFKLSVSIKEKALFFKHMKSGIESLETIDMRYSSRIKTLLIKFDPNEISLQEIIYKTATAYSLVNGLKPIRLIEGIKSQSVGPFAIYAAESIILSGIINIFVKKEIVLKKIMNFFALGLTSFSIYNHAYKEIEQKGYFDIEILSSIYLLKSYVESPKLTYIILMWLMSFGRHLVSSGQSVKIITILKIKDKTDKYSYIAKVSEDKTIENLVDLLNYTFFKKNKYTYNREEYITLSKK